MQINSDIKLLLDNEAKRVNSSSFIEHDPVQFPRMFTSLQDIEIAAIFSSHIAWGNRKMICRDAERMLQLMHYEPHRYIINGEYEYLDPAKNIHRTFFARHMIHMMRGLRQIYLRYKSLDEFAYTRKIGKSETPAWQLTQILNQVFKDANGGESSRYCFPLNIKTTALKRMNMALRWLVRDDGIIDMGVWSSIKSSQLYIPLDVHVGNVSRELGLLQRRSDDRKAVIELTSNLRSLRPDDPCLYDYALFGIGIGI